MSDVTGSEAVAKTAADLKSLSQTASQVGGQAMSAGADAVQQARSLAGEAQERATSLIGEAGEKAAALAETQKEGLAGYLEDIAGAVHRSGEQMEGHQDFIAKMVERGADELGALAGTLRSNDLQSLLGELGGLARRQPALFLGASMAAGFALARVGRIAAAGATTTAPQLPADNGGQS